MGPVVDQPARLVGEETESGPRRTCRRAFGRHRRFQQAVRVLVDEFGRGKAARDCTADEIATEVWRQIVVALTSNVDNAPEELLPWPAWYALDRGLTLEYGPGSGRGPADSEPDARTWFPSLEIGQPARRRPLEPSRLDSWTLVPLEDAWLDNLEQRNVWQARHGGYQVHNNSVVFAGTWTKTFTRMTSMEAACESARHAVNAILDHYVWVESGGLDRREEHDARLAVSLRLPRSGILESSPIADPRRRLLLHLRHREPRACRHSRSAQPRHRLLAGGVAPPVGRTSCVAAPARPPLIGGQPMTMPTDYSQQLLAYLQAWRQVLEQVTPMVPGLSSPPAMPGMPPAMPGMPPVPPTPPAGPTPPMPPSPADYTQQLLAYLQAWRRYLEQATGPATGPPPSHTPASGEQKEVPRRPAHSDVGRGGRVLHSGRGSEAGFQPPDPSTVRVPEPSAVRGREPAGSKVYNPWRHLIKQRQQCITRHQHVRVATGGLQSTGGLRFKFLRQNAPSTYSGAPSARSRAFSRFAAYGASLSEGFRRVVRDHDPIALLEGDVHTADNSVGDRFTTQRRCDADRCA